MLSSQALEAEIQAQESVYRGVLGRGQDQLSKQSQVELRAVQKWIRTLKRQWSRLTDEVTGRRDRLRAAAAIKQVNDGRAFKQEQNLSRQLLRVVEVHGNSIQVTSDLRS